MSGSTIITLRSALKKRKSFHEPLIVDDNFIELVEYPNYYSVMVVNFASNLTENIEKIFYKLILERKRADILVITMKDIERYLLSMRDDPRYSQVVPNIDEALDEEEEVESIIDELPLDQIVMVIKDKIDAAIQENNRMIAQREALAKFRILDYWKTGVGLSDESLSIAADRASESTKKGEKGGDGKKVKPKPKKLKKSKTDVTKEESSTNIGMNSSGEYNYVIPDYEFTSEIWSNLLQRGQQDLYKLYIEDFPLLGPKLYFILLNFRNTDLMVRLLEEKIYLNSVIQILPFGAKDDQLTWNLIDMSTRRLDIFKTVSFFEHHVIFNEQPIKCYVDQMEAYNLICNMVYDADDIRRQYDNFLSNCNLITVADDINVIPQPSEVPFLFSHVIEFYLNNLYLQIHDVNEEEEQDEAMEEEESNNRKIPCATQPISFKLFNDRITIVEDSYKFLKNNYTLDNFGALNETYYKFISNTNKEFFKHIPRLFIDQFDVNAYKYIKKLSKYAYHEIVFKLNSLISNKSQYYRCHFYEIIDSKYRIAHYKYNEKPNCEKKECYEKIVVPTKLCHRDFNEFLLDEIQMWIQKQEFLYNDLLQTYVYEKYLAGLPRHIEFHLKYVRESDFLYEPSIKMEIHIKQQQEFESKKLQEYDKVFQYLENMQQGAGLRPSSIGFMSSSDKLDKKMKKTKSGVEESSSGPRISMSKHHRMSEVQPFDELDQMADFQFFRQHSSTPLEKKKAPIKAFNVYDLGDTRYQIDVIARKFKFKHGCVCHSIEHVLYSQKYQSIELRFCWNRFYINRVFLADAHDHYLTKQIRIITENDTIINLQVNTQVVEIHHTGWTPSSTSSSSSSSMSTHGSWSKSLESNSLISISFVMYWPNGLKVQLIDADDLNDNIIEQKWCERDGYENEYKRWYFSKGCCVVFKVNLTVIVYTPHGIVYEIGDTSEEAEEGEVEDVWSKGPENYEELETIYENELKYLTFLSKFIVFSQFKVTLSDGSIIYVMDGKIVNFVSTKPDKLLVKEHMDYILETIIIRREDGFKMSISFNEQIVIYPDGTIIKTDKLGVVENFKETKSSQHSFEQSESSTTSTIVRRKLIVDNLVDEVIRFSTADHFHIIDRKSFYFFHTNYSTVQWNIETNVISFDNYDRSVNVIYNNGSSITGTLKNNFAHGTRPEKVDDLKFHFDISHMSIEHKTFSSKIHLHYNASPNPNNHQDHILMTTLDHEFLNHMNIDCGGHVNIITNMSEKCRTKMSHPEESLIFNNGDRKFLINEYDDNDCFELFSDDVLRHHKNAIIKEDDCHILVLNNLNMVVNSSFKSTSELTDRIPDRLAVKNVDLCKLDDDALEIHEVQIKKNIFNKLSNRFGFVYYQKNFGSSSHIGFCNTNKIEKLCEDALNYHVDREFQRLIDEREAKRGRLMPSEAFLRKMQEIEERNRLAYNYQIMLRFNIVPKYFDFHENGDHIKYLNVEKYVKKTSKIRYCVIP